MVFIGGGKQCGRGAQMPFSRRAEAEADLIGLKLMALAGYNADKAPETFRRLGAMEVGGKMANMAGSNTARMVLQARAATPGNLTLTLTLSRLDRAQRIGLHDRVCTRPCEMPT